MRSKLAEGIAGRERMTELTSPRVADLAIYSSLAIFRTFGLPTSSGFGRQPAKRSGSTFK